jgi:uncharacterized protein (TIGR03083 family)
MTLPRDQIEKGLVEELSAFSALVRSLDEQHLERPTRCAGWTVRDVAAHVAGTLADVVAGRFDGLGTPEVTQREVDERAGRSAAELADELDEVNLGAQQLLAVFDDDAWEAEAPAGVAPSVGWGVESLWYDAFVHGDDIRAAIGQPSAPSEAMRAAVSHITAVLTDQGYPATTVALDGMEPFDISGGSAEHQITGDPMAFVLAGTGRGDPAALGLDETVNIYR